MDDQSYHYNVMRRAIAEIDAHGPDLSLTELAAKMEMSPAHFQRLFSAWAGVSPKRYTQYLTLDHAKTLLRDQFTTLDVAHSTGLSGGGRLHDLFIRWEAMSPGTYAAGGAGLTIRWAWCDSPFGPALIMATDKGICGMGFAGEMTQQATFDDLARRWPRAEYVEDPAHVTALADPIFKGQGNAQLALIGAPFQIKVWEALLQVPSGHVTTYSQIANRVGNARAVRAVGTAVGRNPISWLIPCHRALRKSGGLGGYHWGLPLKRAMLAREAAQRDARSAERRAG